MNSPISIIIISSDNNYILSETLPILLSQEYDEPYEVIVARETRQGEIKDIVETLLDKHKNLKSTYLPDKPIYATNEQIETLLAVKASAHSRILVVSPSYMPQSAEWLQNVSKRLDNIIQETSNAYTVVLGEQHYSKRSWIYKVRHRLRTNKLIRKKNSNCDTFIKGIRPDKETRNLFTIMFDKNGYINDSALRQVIDYHLRTS